MDELERKTVTEFRQSEKFPIIAVLENVRSAYNVGSVLRTADAFLLSAVYTTGYTAHPPHKQITKTALGADETVASKHFVNATEAIAELQRNGYLIYAIEQVKNSIPLQQFEVSEDDKIAFLFGNEVTGVEQETILLCDGCIEIPQMGTKHSLNIATAAGIVLWECVKQLISFSIK
ncbi:MAG: RNA methyltransferase [Bacteroidota bacterium]|nr:RNA methyltransferase [Bacteroidota bacterium]